MTHSFVFATNNAHKLEEVRAIVGRQADILSLRDINCLADIPETGKTLEENALLKARYVYENYRMNCFADDTGLEVEALNGAPGVYSARYAGAAHNSDANVQKLLLNLRSVANRRARFRTVFAIIINGKEHLFEGVIQGAITLSRRGGSGFGYDPVFMPDGYAKTFAEMDSELKNRISHRAIATIKLCHFIKCYYS
ncbi:MAG: non-canonical purine NTP diphosphatase [Prevotellaceae bacterium]|jgi:XTP/dITP diphosphohydrolase|nr:non-canonical purine NTP diphosphatase [Prevotellaceae bacterium]